MEQRCSPANVSKCQIMSQFEEKLTRKQEAAILALLSSRSVEEAARVAGVNPRSLYRWQKEPAFNAAYRKVKRAAFSQSIARMHQMASAAVTTLGKIMVDPNTPPATKVRAADSILSHTAKAIEIEDAEAHMSELARATELPNVESAQTPPQMRRARSALSPRRTDPLFIDSCQRGAANPNDVVAERDHASRKRTRE
jgi:hypothetical protein